MTLDAFSIYLELSILWHKDIMDNSCNDFDRRWKQGQIDLLQSMVNEIDGIPEKTLMEHAMEFIAEMEECDDNG